MKIAVTGKGGTGKTTIAGVIAHLFKDDGHRVLAVDADPDANLASALGISPEQAAAIVPISHMRELIRERTGADPDRFGQMFKMNPVVSDIPDDYSIDLDGIRLLVMGAVQKGGRGCACAENVLLQSLLSDIVLNRGEVVIVDMEAGIEHLGRATCRAVDEMLITVEPGTRSIETANKIMRLAGDIGITSFAVVGNKIRTDAQAEWLRGQFPENRLIGMIPYSDVISRADRQQKPLVGMWDRPLRAKFEEIYEALRPRV